MKTVVSIDFEAVRRVLTFPAPRVLVIPDKFKGTLTAKEVADEVAAAIVRRNPAAQVTRVPLADGGEGTAAVLADILHLSPAVFKGDDAMMRPVEATYYESDSARGICAVDAAAFVGLTLMPKGVSPWRLTSYPLGVFLKRMLDRGMKRIYVAVGGTATVDAGAGMMQALGYRFYDRDGGLISHPLLPGDFTEVAGVEAPDGVEEIGERITALVDVDLPLLPDVAGEMSSLSFAPQKGVVPSDMPKLDKALRALSSVVIPRNPSAIGEGAGGGIGYALGAVVGAEVKMGAATLIDLSGVFTAARPYDLIVTGEGAFDDQSLTGKLAGTVIARAAGVPVLVVAGVNRLGANEIPAGVAVMTTSSYLPADAPLDHQNALSSLRSALQSL